MFTPLLRMKHWQLFIAIFFIPFILQIVAMSSIFSKVFAQQEPRPIDFAPFLIVFPIMFIIILYCTLGWQWAIVNNLHEKLPADVKVPFKRIKIFYVIQVTYLITLVIGVSLFLYMMIQAFEVNPGRHDPEPPVTLLMLPLLFIPLHLFVIFCQFHNMFFAAKIMKSAELQKPTKFDDFAAEFFLIWFNFIGVWILQPRLNKMIQGKINNSSVDGVVYNTEKDEDEVI